MLELKRVKDKDLKELRDIKERSFSQEFKRLGFTSEEMISIDWHKNMKNDSIYYSINKEGEIIGGINLFKGDEEYYLCSFFIDLSMQNSGLGSTVLKQIEKLHNDGKRWTLETPETSIQNHYFYEKHGYKHINDCQPEGAPEGFSLREYEKIFEK